MVTLIRINQKPVWPWLMLSLLVVITLAMALSWINPGVPKAYIYGVFRELAKTEMSIRTWNWQSVQSEHFIVKYDPQDKNIANMVLKNAEDNYLPVSRILDYYSNTKILVVVYPTRLSLSKSFGWDANESAMGVYWAGVIRVLSPNQWINSKNPQKIERVFASKGPMAHEFTHLIVDYLTKGNYTRWFTEGVAQYNELQITGFKLPNNDQSINKKLYALKDMDGNFDNLIDQGLAYRESLVAIKYLINTYGYDKLLLIMQELGKGKNMDSAMEKVIGVNQGQFQNNWLQWLNKNMFEMG